MPLIDLGEVRALLDAMVLAASVLGGMMAAVSGYRASRALTNDTGPATLAREINEGIAVGFECGQPVSLLALIIGLWT
jgi:hypothetical protein